MTDTDKLAKLDFDTAHRRLCEIMRRTSARAAEQGRDWLEAAIVLKAIFDAFEAKAPDAELGGVKNFKDYLRRQSHTYQLGYSQAMKYIRIAEYVLPRTGEKGLLEIGQVEKADALRFYVAQKKQLPSEIPDELLAQAKDPTVHRDELWNSVTDRVFRGRQRHDEGPWGRHCVVGPWRYLRDVKDAIALGRRQMGEDASEAKVLAWMLAATVTELEAEEKREREKLRGAKEDGQPT